MKAVSMNHIAPSQEQSLWPDWHAVAPDPLGALLSEPDGVLAVITGVEGPSYRPVGAMMAFPASGRPVGSLSSGCIEADLARHADHVRTTGQAVQLRYGRGSPFFDIQLPCGGGLDVMLIRVDDLRSIARALAERKARRKFTLALDPLGGVSCLPPDGDGWHEGVFHLPMRPDPQFAVFGKGPEARIFAGFAQAAGYPVLLLSQDKETIGVAAQMGLSTRHLNSARLPPALDCDQRTAAVLFYHDHDHEPALLVELLRTKAGYIGAQGSQRARDARYAELRRLGVGEDQIARLHGPIGLIPSTRDPRMLAVSVLAEVLQTFANQP